MLPAALRRALGLSLPPRPAARGRQWRPEERGGPSRSAPGEPHADLVAVTSHQRVHQLEGPLGVEGAALDDLVVLDAGLEVTAVLTAGEIQEVS